MSSCTSRFERSLSSLDELFDTIQLFATESRLSQHLANELAVVLEELFVNAVRHSTGTRGNIELNLSLQANILSIRLIDQQVDKLDITQLPPTNLDIPIEERRTGGMGLHIVRHFADQFHYSHENGNGIITIEKKIEGSDVSDTK